MMTFDFPCSQCGLTNIAEWRQAGRPMRCAGCGESILVPAPCEPVEDDTEPPPAWRPVPTIRFACDGCGRKYSTKPAMAGKRIKCGGCGAKIYVPGLDGTVPERTERPRPRPQPATVGRARSVPDPVPDFDFIVEEEDDLPLAPLPPRASGLSEREEPSELPSRPRKKKRKRKSSESHYGSIRSRVFGVLMIFVSFFIIVFTLVEAFSTGKFLIQVSFAGPFCFFLGLWWVIEGPPLNERPRFSEMSALGKLFNILGTIFGLLYVNFLRSGHPFGNPF